MAKKEKAVFGDARKAARGYVLMAVPDGSSGCSFDGTEYEIEDGLVEVPAEIVLELSKHGFKAIE